ncbi:craniofacial development protein 2-like [Entelurus aequoreus]|uniref:craniofacial development protein 2-like n=1 Tax=Entelurus aequoreus TaxID=161455 RepID=UPI002B1E01DF|nr:craniofacial development protein 2-like [Entelurus aequoreus]
MFNEEADKSKEGKAKGVQDPRGVRGAERDVRVQGRSRSRETKKAVQNTGETTGDLEEGRLRKALRESNTDVRITEGKTTTVREHKAYGLSDDLQAISDARKTSVINDELVRLQVDIAVLQETRLVDSGTLRENNFTFFWQGKSAEETREYGVGFAVRNSLLGMIEPCQQGTERLLSLRLHTTTGPVNLISVYAPTLSATRDTKDEFYSQLDALIDRIPKEEHLILLGDFNARVGTDHDSWPSCLGKFGVGKMNENGQRLLEFCSYHDLSITNSFFQTKPQHKVSWRHPRSKHWHQLDLIITRRSALKCVLLTRSFHSADCNTDHLLVYSKMRLLSKKIHRSRPQGKYRIDVSKTAHPDKVAEFTQSLSEVLDSDPPGGSATERWDRIRESVHSTAMMVFGKKQTNNNDRFEANSSILTPAVEERRRAHLEYKRSPSQRTLQVYISAKSKVQRLARQCANEYWLQLCQSIQLAADTGNIRGM